MDTKISKKGFTSIIFFLTEPMFLHVGLTKILNSAENGSIYSIFLGIIFSLILLFFIIKYCNYEKDLSLFKKNEKLFGKTLGKIINLLLTILFLFYFIYLLYSVNTYIQNKYLDSTPNYIIIILFIIPVIWCASLNMKVISKVSLSVFLVTVLIIAFSIFNLTSSIDIENFKPFFNTPFITIFKNSITFTSYFVTPTFMMLTVPKNEIYDSKNLTKTVLFFYLFSGINFLILFTYIIGVFGIDLAKMFSYPEYSLMKKVNYFEFIQHVENISTIEWLYSLFISNVIALNFIKEYLKYINLYKKKIFYCIIILCFIPSLFLFKNTTVSYNFASNYYTIIYFIPILILILISDLLIKRNKN